MFQADSRIFVHAKHATKGSETIMIKANDSDILVIALSIFPSLQELGLQQLWVTLGHGVSLRWIGVHELYRVIGPVKTKGNCSFTLSQAEILYQPFANKDGKPGTFALRPLPSPPN